MVLQDPFRASALPTCHSCFSLPQSQEELPSLADGASHLGTPGFSPSNSVFSVGGGELALKPDRGTWKSWLCDLDPEAPSLIFLVCKMEIIIII